MDRLSSYAIRIALCWLVLGVIIGAAMLTDRDIPGQWKVWFSPVHAHILFVGWFFQFTMGVAYWLLPRKRSPEKRVGYREDLGFLALGLLNVGLGIRVVTEPLERAGNASNWTRAGLAISAVTQVVAFVIFATQLWPRVAPKPVRPS